MVGDKNLNKAEVKQGYFKYHAPTYSWYVCRKGGMNANGYCVPEYYIYERWHDNIMGFSPEQYCTSYDEAVLLRDTLNQNLGNIRDEVNVGIKVGDQVFVKDGSGATEVKDGKLIHHQANLNKVHSGVFTVVSHNKKYRLPFYTVGGKFGAEESYYDSKMCHNDTIVKNNKTGQIYFVCSKFLKPSCEIKIIKIGKYTVGFDDKSVKIGCVTLSNADCLKIIKKLKSGKRRLQIDRDTVSVTYSINDDVDMMYDEENVSFFYDSETVEVSFEDIAAIDARRKL